jgi:hypothetical protein
MSKESESRWHDQRRAAAREILEEALADTADLQKRIRRALEAPHEAPLLFGMLLGTATRWRDRINAYHRTYIAQEKA